MKPKPQPIKTITVPDYKPSFAVAVICLTTIAVVCLLRIRSAERVFVPPHSLQLNYIRVTATGGHSYFAFDGGELIHESDCPACHPRK